MLQSPAAMMCLARGPAGAGTIASAFSTIVTVRILGGLTSKLLFSFPADLSAPVHDVKEMITRIVGIPPREQRLVSPGGLAPAGHQRGGGVLENHRTLGDALGVGTASLDTVDLQLVRLPGQWAARLEGIATGAVCFEDLDEASHDDSEMALAAVQRNGLMLAHASERLRGERTIVLEAIRNQPKALQFASSDTQGDREIVLEAVNEDPAALNFAAPSLQADREVVFRAVQAGGQSLKFASQDLRADPDVVLAAMRSAWRALEFADPALHSDRSFMLRAVRVHGSALLHASRELKGDRELVLSAVRRSGWALSCASEELRRDRTCVLAAVLNNPAALHFAAEELQDDPDFTSISRGATGRGTVAPCGQGPPCTLL